MQQWGEKRLKGLLKNLGHLPPPYDFDGDEQAQLASVWAPILKDYEVPGADAPPWLKWATALISTAAICAPKVMAAEALAAQAEAESASGDETGESEAEAEAKNGGD
jgi:hypothetical protein